MPTDIQMDVGEFHRALKIPISAYPKHLTPARAHLRAALISEEASETCKALQVGDLLQIIDGLCDLLCVVYGTAVELGVRLEPFWREVHKTNIAKQGGPTRDDGKILKPQGWIPPDLNTIFVGFYGKFPEEIT